MFPVKTLHLVVIALTTWCLIKPPIDGTLIPVILLYMLGFGVACYYAIVRCRYAEALLNEVLRNKPWGVHFDIKEYGEHINTALMIAAMTSAIFCLALFIPNQIVRILTFGAGIFSAIFCLYMFVVGYEYVIEAAES